MEDIIKWMTQRIKDEYRKHSAHNDNWAELAARKLFATYEITLRKPDVSGRSEQLKCEHEPVSLKGKYTNCKHCTTILQLKP